MQFLLGIYVIAAVCLAIYGFNTWIYVILFLLKGGTRTAPARRKLPDRSVPERFPFVTVQLPIYNELYVVERLIDAAAGLDWPRSRLQIQVLDDSDDETTQIAQARVDYHRKRGVNIELCRRESRRGYKAGALAAAFTSARGEFLTIFDADFIPPRTFLKQTIPYFLDQPQLGLVQARWGHVNDEYSSLTRAQAMALDAHFAIEQNVRSKMGWFMNFNGTAGVWRRACIESVGGWQPDTLCEDMDLSYRAHLSGWKFLFLNDVVSPAEVPPQIHAFKRQQFRWAKGTTQCLLKFARRLTTEPIPFAKRVESFLHLSAYTLHPISVVMLLALVPLTLNRVQMPAPLSLFSLASFGPPLLFALGQRALHKNWLSRIAYFPVLVLLGIGLAFNNALAVLSALARRPSTFRRTPKFNVVDSRHRWDQKRYALPFGWEIIGEIGLALYAGIGVHGALETGQYWLVPWLSLYVLGFGYVAALTMLHSRARPVAAREHGEATGLEEIKMGTSF